VINGRNGDVLGLSGTDEIIQGELSFFDSCA
jgi:hypothetical protein